MGIFGNMPRAPLSFGMEQPDLYGTQPIGMDQQQVQLPPDSQVARALRPGFFGKGGDWTKVLGTLGDALQIAGGGRATYAPGIQAQVDEQRKRQQEIEDYRMKMQLKAQQPATPSNAAKMAAEIGLQPGTAEWQKFITRYAFKPTILSVGNTLGGEDKVEYDPSGMSGAPSGGLPSGYNPDEWEVVE